MERFIKLIEDSSATKTAFAIVYSSPVLGYGIYHCQRLYTVRYVDCLFSDLRTVITLNGTAVVSISVIHIVPF